MIQASVVIPTRDRRPMLREALDSVQRQTVTIREVIVVDDGSGDGTADMLRRSYPEATLVTGPLQGPGAARNTGAGVASGDVLLFLDSDDLWHPDHAARLLHKIGEGFQVAYGVTETENLLDGSRFLIPETGQGAEGDCLASLRRWCSLVPSSLAVTREAFQAAGGFPELPRGEDWAFVLKLARRHGFGFVPGPAMTRRRLHAGSLSAVDTPATLSSMLEDIIACLRQDDAMTDDDTATLSALLDWTRARQTRGWRTVQDWYRDLVEERMHETT